MKILTVLGSTREGSRSLKVVSKILERAEQNGCEIKTYDINAMNLKGCVGCGVCRKNGIDCVQQDGLAEYFKDLHQCDALIISGANYYSMPCGQMITYMNRHYCLTDSNKNIRLERGKKLISVFSQGAPENYPKYVQNYEWYLNTFTSKGMELIKHITIGGDSDLSDAGEIMTIATQIGEALK